MPETDTSEIDIGNAIASLWQRKWVVIGVSSFTTVVAVVISLWMPDVYRAEALVAPNHQERPGGFAAQYSGLASLAGLDLSPASSDKTTLALEILRSRRFLSGFVQEHDILVSLIAAKGWDSASNQITIDRSLYDAQQGQWVRKVRPPKKQIPSMQEAYEAFLDIMIVNEDPDTGLISISVEHVSPATAQQWVEWLISDINRTVLEQDVTEAEQAIAYLRKQIDETSLTGLQAVLFRLIEDQLKTVMLANATSEYVFRTIDPAVVPETKVRPKRALIAAAGLIAGGFAGVLLVLVWGGFKQPARD